MKTTKIIMTALFLSALSSAYAVESKGASIVGIDGYGGFSSLGPQTIARIHTAIKYECLVNRKAKLLTKIDCIKFEDDHIYRLCLAVCSSGNNTTLAPANDTREFIDLPKVTK